MDVPLDDNKVSSRHAQIEADFQGSYILVDNKSTNGILVKGRKQPSVDLTPGVIFMIGKTSFEVFVEEEPLNPPPPKDPSDPTEVLFPVAPALDQSKDFPAAIQSLLPKDILLGALRRAQKGMFNSNAPIYPFPFLLEFYFLTGPQAGTQKYFGYGPRFIGRSSWDLALLEPNSPEICFSIEMGSHREVIFKTEYPEIVHWNEQNLSTAALSPKDVIRIGDTRIEIRNGDKGI